MVDLSIVFCKRLPEGTSVRGVSRPPCLDRGYTQNWLLKSMLIMMADLFFIKTITLTCFPAGCIGWAFHDWTRLKFAQDSNFARPGWSTQKTYGSSVHLRERDVGHTHTCHSNHSTEWITKTNQVTTANVVRIPKKTCRLIGERIPCHFCRGFVFFRMVKKFDFWAQNLSIGYLPCGAPRWLPKKPWDIWPEGTFRMPLQTYDEIYPLTGRFKEILKFRKVDSLYFSYDIFLLGIFLKPCSERKIGNLLDAGKGIGAATKLRIGRISSHQC